MFFMNKKIVFVFFIVVILFFVFFKFYFPHYYKGSFSDFSSFGLVKNFTSENYGSLFFFENLSSADVFLKNNFYYCYNKTAVYNKVFSELYLFNVSFNDFGSVPCFSVYYRYLENEGYPLTGGLRMLYSNVTLFNNDSFPHFYSYVYVFKFDNFSDSRSFFDFLFFVFNSDGFNKYFSYYYFYKDVDDIPFYSSVGSNYKDLFYYKNWFFKDNLSFYHHTLVILYDDKVLVSKTFTNSSTVKYYVSTIT